MQYPFNFLSLFLLNSRLTSPNSIKDLAHKMCKLTCSYEKSMSKHRIRKKLIEYCNILIIGVYIPQVVCDVIAHEAIGELDCLVVCLRR